MLRRAAIGLVAALTAIALVLAVVYLNRRAAAREVLTGWLDRRGIEAQVEVERLEIDGFVGRVTIGDPNDPDVRVERVEVDYAVGLPWTKAGLGVVPSRIRLVRPVVRAVWTEGRLSFGSLDPLIEEFTGRPPRPDSTAPIVIIESGTVRLNTEYGPLQLLGDARVEDGKLMRVQARMPAASLRSGEVEARGMGGTIDLTTTGDRVALTVTASAERFALADLSGQAARFAGTADLPYPDLHSRRGDGRAVLNLALSGRRLTLGRIDARDARGDLAFDGVTQGWIEAFRILGQTSATVRAAGLSAPGVDTDGASVALPEAALTLSRNGAGLGWRLDGPATLQVASARAGDLALTKTTARTSRLVMGGRGGAFEAAGPVALTVRGLTFGDLSLSGASGTVDLDLISDGATLVTATGAVRSTGGSWPLFGPVGSEDVPELIEMKRAMGAFAFDAPGLRLTTGSPGTELVLTRPARLSPRNGGVLTLNPVARPLYAAEPGQRGGGALTLAATRGRGLPDATFAVPDWSLTPGGFEARLDGRAALDFGVARGLTLMTSGRLANDTGRLTYAADACIPFTVARLDLDENDTLDLSGDLCPPTGPLVVVQDGAWRAEGSVRDTAATVPFLFMQVDQAAGSVVATGSSAGLGLDARIASARVRDTAAPLRFYPLSASGKVGLRAERWTAAFDLARNAVPVGQVRIDHDGVAQAGAAVLDFPSLTFAEGALQPADLSPLVEPFLQPPVTGTAAFSGRFVWSGGGGESSSGLLTVPGLDFTSPAGPVRGLNGSVAFTSLAPLVTAPDQTLNVERLDAFADLTDLDLTFSLDEAAVTVAGGTTAFAGGTISVEPFSVPLDRTQPFSGVIVLDQVQLGEVIAQSGFGDKVQMDAVVSGRLPFTSDPSSGVRVTAGTLYAVQPGRLSIQRTALNGLDAGGGGEAIPPGTVEDLAYQAMENLAFETLSADVNSLDAGLMGVLFRIQGRHDPPERQELRLPIMDFISRRFLEQTLPLPSDTGINLTLDTTLNLNELIGKLLEVNRLRSGETVPPSSPDEP